MTMTGRQLNEIYAERRKLVFEIMDLLKCEYDPGQVGLLSGDVFLSILMPGNYDLILIRPMCF